LRLAQALANVLDNSIIHTPPQGRITVRVHADQAGVAIDVQDFGPGIPPQMLRDSLRLFAARPASNGIRRGLGIGLALTRSLVEMHGGSVSLSNNREGTGAHFRLWLPAPAMARPASSGEDEHGYAAIPRRKVLLLDADPESAEFALTLLRLMGQDVRHAPDRASAERIEREFKPDVIFSSEPATGRGATRVPIFRFPEHSEAIRTILTSLDSPARQQG
jgi:hypothetical protein